MHHKITHAMVGIVAGALILAVALFSLVTLFNNREAEAAQVARQPVIPPIAHPVNEAMAECARCHSVGDGEMPASHLTYGGGTCLTCHAVADGAELAAGQQGEPAAAGGAVSPVPHPVGDAYANCVGCHAIGGNRAMPDNHVTYTDEMCVTCHLAPGAEEPGADTATRGAGRLVPHDVDGQFVNCDSCHALDMGRLAMPADHEGFTKETCLNCHKPAE